MSLVARQIQQQTSLMRTVCFFYLRWEPSEFSSIDAQRQTFDTGGIIHCARITFQVHVSTSKMALFVRGFFCATKMSYMLLISPPPCRLLYRAPPVIAFAHLRKFEKRNDEVWNLDTMCLQFNCNNVLPTNLVIGNKKLRQFVVARTLQINVLLTGFFRNHILLLQWCIRCVIGRGEIFVWFIIEFCKCTGANKNIVQYCFAWSIRHMRVHPHAFTKVMTHAVVHISHTHIIKLGPLFVPRRTLHCTSALFMNCNCCDTFSPRPGF